MMVPLSPLPEWVVPRKEGSWRKNWPSLKGERQDETDGPEEQCEHRSTKGV